MIDNIFFQKSIPSVFEKSKRVYMRLDHSRRDVLVFDAVSADYLDSLPEIQGVAEWSQYSSKAPLFVIEIKKSEMRFRIQNRDEFDGWMGNKFSNYYRYNNGHPPLVMGLARHGPGSIWLEGLISWSSGSDIIYPTLFGEGVRASISDVKYVNPVKSTSLDTAFSLKNIYSKPSEISNIIDSIKDKIEWVGIYDVGQGSASALCDANETPLLYFDLGGGVKANISTFPAAFTDFCYLKNPPVVLSHWDWDHWSSGSKFQDASKRKWIVPQQWLGGVHATFAAGLFSANNLLVWPKNLNVISSGQIKIIKCSGKGKGRNHTGLAMEVTGPSGEAPILLPGDCRYSAIPGALGKDYTSLVLPHHGADMKSARVPMFKNLPGARTALSFGPSNTFKHPLAVTLRQHLAAGWPQSTAQLQTTARRPDLGHIGLTWQPQPLLPGHVCSQSGCAVQFRQT